MVLTYQHLESLTDERGLFEHAEYDQPRIEHGYCVDDVARALTLLMRDKDTVNLNSRGGQSVCTRRGQSLVDVYINFIRDSQTDDGLFINRCDVNGVWTGLAEPADHWGRALWALGTMYKESPDRDLANEALERFELGARHRSRNIRSMMFAGLGAAEVLSVARNNRTARKMLRDAALTVASRIPSSISYENLNPTYNANNPIPPKRSQTQSQMKEWLWPEDRLTYANAVIPEVLLLAGNLLTDQRLTDYGLALLTWLIETETQHGHLSVTPTSGYGPGEERNTYDQQPIEVAALIDACSTAFEITGNDLWLNQLARGYLWFEGYNDGNVRMFDPETGAGFDGITANGRNENRGAESTISYLSATHRFQQHFPRSM